MIYVKRVLLIKITWDMVFKHPMELKVIMVMSLLINPN